VVPGFVAIVALCSDFFASASPERHRNLAVSSQLSGKQIHQAE
jgi:hypothetical protein